MLSALNNGKRKDIEIAKGIGIILVLIGHIQASGAVYDSIYLFHMPLFFIISGLFLRPEDSMIAYLKKKYYRLLDPIIYYSLILIPLSVIYTILECSHGLTLRRILYAIIPFNYDVPLWFSVVLYVSLALLQLNIRKKFPYLFIFLVFCLIITELVAVRRFPYIPYISQIFFACLFVGLGYLLRTVFLSNNKWLELTMLVVSIIIMVYAISSHVELDINAWIVNKNIIINLLAGLSGSYIVIFLSRMIMNGVCSKPLVYLGENSFIIYCLHWPMVKILWPLLPPPNSKQQFCI